MSNSLLKKEFNKADVTRMRNLVKGNLSGSTQSMVGYQHKEERHKEGDVWTDSSGKTWTIKNGLKSSVPKLQSAREAARMPLVCPKCGKPLNTRLDKKIFPIHGMCYECVVKMEDDLKRAGLYDQFEQAILTQNIVGFLQDMQDRIKDIQADAGTRIATEDGLLEDWGNTSAETVRHLREWVQLLSEKVN